MGAYDFQLGFIDEVTFNTPLAVTRFAEYNGDVNPIKPIVGRTEGDPLRVGSRARRQSRTIPYQDRAEGSIPMDVMNKGFGFWLKYMLPAVAATGSGPYVYTATEGTSSQLNGKSFTAQFNAPLHPAGTNQAFTYSGGKVLKWHLANTVDDMLTCTLDTWFASWTKATALAVASYPSSMVNFSWAGAVATVGGSAFDVTNIAIDVDQGYKVGRAQLRGVTTQKEPTPGKLGITFALEADFSDTTQYDRVHSATTAGLSAAITATWTNSTDVLAVTIPAGRFDNWELGGDRGALTQKLTGIGEYDGTNSPITVAYTTSDATA